MEGPRPLRPEETLSMAQLVDAIFMNGREGAMARCFPQMFDPSNSHNHLVIADGGRVVSHVGMTQRWACLNGCTVRVGSIGAVATYEEYRGKRLASMLMDAVIRKAVADGVDFFIISGNRTLYRRAGAVEVGTDTLCLVQRDVAQRLADDVTVTDSDEADLPLFAAAYGRRPARFIRPPQDWRWLFEGRTCAARDVRLLTVERRGVFRGYFVVSNTSEEGVGRVAEFAGDDLDLAAAFAPMLDLCGWRAIEVRLQVSDQSLRSRFEHAGIACKPVVTGGTFLILRFEALMERLRPWFESKAGSVSAARLSFSERAETFTFSDGSHTLTLEGQNEKGVIEEGAARAEAVRVLFGHPQARALPGLLEQVFPVPTLWCGINYV